MRDHPERFVERNTDNSWLRYLNDMCIQGTWSDALIVQAVADALNVVIHIVESNPGFSPITTVYPVQERNSLSTITIGHIISGLGIICDGDHLWARTVLVTKPE